MPENATPWTTRTLAAHLGLSPTPISRIWRAFALAPHRTEGFKLSTDPYFVDMVRDIVGLYLHPPERALVLCVDEKPSIQAHSDTAPAIPMQSGQPERHTHDYLRHGTTDLFAALDVKAETVIAEVHRRHRSVEFRHFLQTVEHATPAELDLHLVLDNASTHKSPIIQRWLLRHPRVHLHFTPTSASWINLVECWFSLGPHGPASQAWAVSLDPRIAERHPCLRGYQQRESEAIRLDQNCRPDPSVRRRVLRTNFKLSPLVQTLAFGDPKPVA